MTTTQTATAIQSRSAQRGWTSIPVLAMVALAIVCAVAGVVLLTTTGGSDAAPDPNRAVVDRAGTTEVIGQVDTALQRVLSYDYANPDATHTAAQQTLVGDALKQYNVLFDALQQKAGGQQLTLTAKVVTAGVTSLEGTRAELLVFLDQSSTRASDGTTGTSAAQIRISAVKQGGTWRISELVPL